MSKTIATPKEFRYLDKNKKEHFVKNLWPGTVTLYDPLTLPQVEAIEDALDFDGQEGAKVFYTVIDKNRLPAIVECVEKWNIENFPEDVNVSTFPLSPRRASHEFVSWLFDEIMGVYFGANEVPNE